LCVFVCDDNTEYDSRQKDIYWFLPKLSMRSVNVLLAGNILFVNIGSLKEECILPTWYIGLYAFLSKEESVPIFRMKEP
jgi:hypothetical protein